MKPVFLAILILSLPLAAMAEPQNGTEVSEGVVIFGLQNDAASCDKEGAKDADWRTPQGSDSEFGVSCSATANCWNGSTVGCSVIGTSNCVARNHNCSVPYDGWVFCGSTFKFCPGCPSGGGQCVQGASCISGIDCGADGQCSNGSCQCD